MNMAEFAKEVREIARYNEFNLSNEEAITAILQAAEALATQRAVELAEKVIGEDEEYSKLKECRFCSQRQYSCSCAYAVDTRLNEQRAALAQLKGLERR